MWRSAWLPGTLVGDMSEFLLFVLVAAVCVGMVVVAIRIEPHWVARDGSRFLTTAQPMDRLGRIIGRRREVRVSFLPEGRLMVSRRALVRSSSAVCRLEAKSPHPPKGRQVYLLRTMAADDDGELLALARPVEIEGRSDPRRVGPAGARRPARRGQRSDT